MLAKRGAWGEYTERQHQGLAKLHAERRLISELAEMMRRSAKGSTGTPQQLKAMGQAIKNGFQPWEEILIRRGEKWTDYFNDPRVRAGVEREITEAKQWAKWS